MLLMVSRLSEIISLPPQIWSQQELKLLHWRLKICTNMYESIRDTALNHEMMNPESLFLPF